MNADIVVNMQELGHPVLFPDISLLYSFTMHARFPVMPPTDKPLRIVDVGGCVGGFTLAAMLSYPNATFTVIEPYSDCDYYLDKNLGNRQNVKIYKCAASNMREELYLSFSKRFSRMGQASVYGDGILTQKVDAYPLDELIKTPVDVLKVDVEGHEFAVLKGAQLILSEWRPGLLVEIKENHQQRAGHTKAEIIRYLMNVGYGAPEEIGYDYWFEGGK